MFITRISNFIILSLGLLAGMALAGTFKGCDFKKQGTVQLPPDPSLIRRAVKAREQTFQHRLDSLQNANAVLQQQVTGATARLDAARKRSWHLQQQYRQVQHNPTKGTTGNDSLQSLTTAIVDNGLEKDSLCDAVITGLQLQVSNKDSTLSLQTEQYQALRYCFAQCTDQNKERYGYYRRQQRRHKVQTRLLSAGITLLSGLAAFELLHH